MQYKLNNIFKAILIAILIFPKIITTQKLFNKLKFNEVVEINKIWLDKNMKCKSKLKKEGVDFFYDGILQKHMLI
jgi:hypothetical protein